MKCFFEWVLIASLGAPSMVLGTTFVQTNAFILKPGETLGSELWLMANQIRIEGNVKDDVFLLATTSSLWGEDTHDGLVTLAGEFHNDVWAMGNTVELTGIVQDHARFLARTIRLSGSIARNSMFVGNTIHLTRSADIAGDVWIAGENLIVEGWVEGNVTLIGKNVTLSGTFGQDVVIIAQDLVALPGTEIMGNLTYRCPKEFASDNRVIIHGKEIREIIPEPSSGIARGFSLESFVYQSWLFLGAIMVAMLFIAVFPAFTIRSVRGIRYSPLKCMATGFMVLGLIPLIAVFALISIIGIPLGLLLLITLVTWVYLSKIMVAVALGIWLLRRPEPGLYSQFLLPLIAGLLLVYAGVNSGLPGLALWFIVTTIGLGGLVQALFTGLHSSAISLNPNLPPAPRPKDNSLESR